VIDQANPPDEDPVHALPTTFTTLTLAAVTLAGCKDTPSGPRDVTVTLTNDTGLTAKITGTVPKGWRDSHIAGKPNQVRALEFETAEDGLSKVKVELADKSAVPSSLDVLVAATEASRYKVLDKETTPTGFGVSFNNGRSDMFAYYATVGGHTFSCLPADIGYDGKYVADCKKICASLH
jgi:hypothetical protein